MLRDKQNKKNSGQRLAVFPAWVYERPTLIGDFLTGSGLSTDTAAPIGTRSMCFQRPAWWARGQVAAVLRARAVPTGRQVGVLACRHTAGPRSRALGQPSRGQLGQFSETPFSWCCLQLPTCGRWSRCEGGPRGCSGAGSIGARRRWVAVLLGLLGLSSDLLGCLKGAVSHCAFMTELVGILQSVMKTSFIPEQRVSDTHTHSSTGCAPVWDTALV